MTVTFQFNDKKITIHDFKENDIPQVEQYFYNPRSNNNTLDREEFFRYVGIMRQTGMKRGSMTQSCFAPAMEIILD